LCFKGAGKRSGDQCRAPRWDCCWRSRTEGRPRRWSPHHCPKLEPADALPSCAGGSSSTRNAHTLTDLSCSNGAEVELVSLIEEQLPRYRLRADTLTEFGGYDKEDWSIIPSPCLPSPENLDLPPELIQETLNYFGE
ncbi:hypothetical protein MTO96_026024, partial [Rhipicephalus appendiculatus]